MKARCVLFGLLLLLCMPTVAIAQEQDEIREETQRQLEEYDLSSWENALLALPEEIRMLWDGASIAEWMADYAGGGYTVDYAALTAKLKTMLMHALKQNASMMVRFFVVALLTGLLGTLFEETQGVREVLLLLCYGMTVAMSVSFFLDMVQTAQQTMERLSALSALTTPVLVTMLSATGRVSSAGMLRPLMAFLSGGVLSFFSGTVLPVVTAAALLSIAGNLTKRQELRRFGALLKSMALSIAPHRGED